MGRSWYTDGKLLHKKNTFTDFIACARHLAETGWTSAPRLVARGGSAGGLLMGAVANMAPEVYAGSEAHVPIVHVPIAPLDLGRRDRIDQSTRRPSKRRVSWFTGRGVCVRV